jgi:hypothetical protein
VNTVEFRNVFRSMLVAELEEYISEAKIWHELWKYTFDTKTQFTMHTIPRCATTSKTTKDLSDGGPRYLVPSRRKNL